MHNGYPDIRQRIDEEPAWYDDNGTPRYGEFHPTLLPNIYAQQAVLLEIGCQGCALIFRVAIGQGLLERINRTDIEKPYPTLEDLVRTGSIHYGDPPSHVETDHAGSTMNCIDRKVLQFWKRGEGNDPDWYRVPELEITFPEDGTAY